MIGKEAGYIGNRVGTHVMKYLRLYIRLWFKHQIPMRAAALTYTFILAIVPALAVGLSVITVIFDLKKKYQMQFKLFLLKNLAAGAGDTVTRYIDGFIENVRLKTIGYVGFAFLVITSLLLLSSVENTINRIWAIRRPKKVWKRVLIYNLILLFGPVAIVISLAATTLFRRYLPHMVLEAKITSVLLNTMVLAFIYQVMPNQKVRIGGSLISAFTTALVFELAKWAFALYTAKAIFYNKVYGSLATLPILLIWIFVNWCLFLGGALFHFILENRKGFYVRGHLASQKKGSKHHEKT